jgi:hypothetical protein
MIIDATDKRIVFGMEWKTFLGEGDIHREARKTKSPLLWTSEKASYYGVLAEGDRQGKLKQLPYAAAIALLNRYQDAQNLLLVLELDQGGFILCGFHQRRPKQGFDIFVGDESLVQGLLDQFGEVCGPQGFNLHGNVTDIPGIIPASMEDVVAGANAGAQLRRVKSALVNPTVAIVSGVVVLSAAWYGYHAFTKYRAAEAQRKAMAMQKGAQQLYMEELAIRRSDAALLATSVPDAVAPIRLRHPSVGGWKFSKADCSVGVQKQLSCTFTYDRRPGSSATNKSFVEHAKGDDALDSFEFFQDRIVGVKAYTKAAFHDTGKAVDSAKSERDETVEFGSLLQQFARVGKTALTPFKPFAVPSGTNVAELTSPPGGVADWEWNAPLRAMRSLPEFPTYATVSKVVINFSDRPGYEIKQSLAMVTVSGKVFSKPN